MRKFPKKGGASRKHARSPRQHLSFTKEGPARPLLTFFDDAHGENGRAQAAHSGAPERNRNGYDARPKSHDRSQPPDAHIAATTPPAPWCVPLHSTCMHTTHNAILKGARGSGTCCVRSSLWRMVHFSHIDLRARLPNPFRATNRPGRPSPTSRTSPGPESSGVDDDDGAAGAGPGSVTRGCGSQGRV